MLLSGESDRVVIMIELQVDILDLSAYAEGQAKQKNQFNPGAFHLFLSKALDTIGLIYYPLPNDNATSLSKMDNNTPLSFVQGVF